MAITYENIFYNFVLDPIRDLIVGEYAGARVYIAPEIDMKYTTNTSFRVWGTSAELVEYASYNAHTRNYIAEIALYIKNPNPNEAFYKKLYNDGERLHQLIFENNTKQITVGSTTLQWQTATITSMEINSLEEEAAEVEGLHTIKCDFSCNITAIV